MYINAVANNVMLVIFMTSSLWHSFDSET